MGCYRPGTQTGKFENNSGLIPVEVIANNALKRKKKTKNTYLFIAKLLTNAF